MDKIPNGKHSFQYDLSEIDATCQMARALSSPVRLEILKLLIGQSMTMSELAQALYVSMSSISMHTKILNSAGLITVVPKPGMHGAQKICGIRTERVVFDFFTSNIMKSMVEPVVLDIPVGSYSEAEIKGPCGLVNNENYLGIEDTRYGFFDIGHAEAQLIWFTSGYLTYRITNKFLIGQEVKCLNISFEVCAEAPGYNNDWPSDIYIKINGERVTEFRVKGDYGQVRGINNPQWWSDSNTQYGELKLLSITNKGTYLNGKKVSIHTLSSLRIKENYYFSFQLGVDEQAEFVGGLNLFGKNFGNYSQDIRVEIQYK